ncbi:hypothetical protein BCT30_23225 [Enterovibrio norvegicus]|uniref:Uncharacterized protein n=1 Tax=Enterovibrio norvegicus TaxID=188144 RepID=A0A2N7LCC5_9GAMM|nr:hypothetical protein A1OU_04560 [Enterovibrio norvegicus]OEF61122.1 hypothetical protein A1OW_03495 [Enterovibrio norvegicus]PMH63922.1 hypothetical protein BCU62_17600 [Enterovibrio norvegicus]PMI34530.1 hypothetical protein BCU47_06270 [Enterovibrio norvegicus]PMI37273.1 hypothetical protein BCU46_12445 [Enterovibrio norvegicus]
MWICIEWNAWSALHRQRDALTITSVKLAESGIFKLFGYIIAAQFGGLPKKGSTTQGASSEL